MNSASAESPFVTPSLLSQLRWPLLGLAGVLTASAILLFNEKKPQPSLEAPVDKKTRAHPSRTLPLMLDTNAAETAKAAASDRPQILPPAAPSTAKKALESEVTPEFLEKLSWEMTQKDAEIDRLRESVNGAMLQTQQSQLLAQQQANSYLAELATRQQNLAAAESLDRHYTQILSDAEQVYDDLELENQRLRTVYRSSVQECRTLETANSTLQDSVNQCRIEISQLRSQILHLEAALQQALHEKDNDPKDPKDPSGPQDPAKPQTPEQPSLPTGGPRYGR